MSKQRLCLHPDLLDRFMRGEDVEREVVTYNLAHGDSETICRSYRNIRKLFREKGLKPVLLVAYKRVAFQGRAERLSLDWDIHYCPIAPATPIQDAFAVASENTAGRERAVLLEIKYPDGKFPQWVEQLQRG